MTTCHAGPQNLRWQGVLPCVEKRAKDGKREPQDHHLQATLVLLIPDVLLCKCFSTKQGGDKSMQVGLHAMQQLLSWGGVVMVPGTAGPTTPEHFRGDCQPRQTPSPHRDNVFEVRPPPERHLVSMAPNAKQRRRTCYSKAPNRSRRKQLVRQGGDGRAVQPISKVGGCQTF